MPKLVGAQSVSQLALCEVRRGGLQTTLQDGGRMARSKGIPVGGAVDLTAWRLANALVGNHSGEAGLEMTLQGAELFFLRDAVVALVGAPFEVTLDGQLVTMGRALRVSAGQMLSVGGCMQGMRCVLAVRGGWSGSVVFGSRSTNIQAGFGGMGRALQRGDVLQSGESDIDLPLSRAVLHPDLLTPISHQVTLRVVAAECEAPWLLGIPLTVGIQDRMGVRLMVDLSENPAAEPDWATRWAARPSLPTVRGAVQLPPDGSPILLLPDAGTHGGYPVPFVVCAADLPRLGQLRTGNMVVFTQISAQEAVQALRLQEGQLRAAERMLLGELGKV